MFTCSEGADDGTRRRGGGTGPRRVGGVWGILLLDARSGGYNVRRDRFVVPRPKP
jgi:hypothetical protein